MTQLTINYSRTFEPWLEVWLKNFVITTNGIPVSRQEMILLALRHQAETDLAKILSSDQLRVLFYSSCNRNISLEDSNPPIEYPEHLTMYELVNFVAKHSHANPKAIYSTLKTVGRTKIRQIRLQFANWSVPAYYHPSEPSRDTWQLQGLT